MSGATEAGNISVGEAGTAQVLGVEGAVGIETLAKRRVMASPSYCLRMCIPRYPTIFWPISSIHWSPLRKNATGLTVSCTLRLGLDCGIRFPSGG